MRVIGAREKKGGAQTTVKLAHKIASDTKSTEEHKRRTVKNKTTTKEESLCTSAHH